MGTFLTAFHLRTCAADEVQRVAREIGATPAFLGDPENGWTSLYPRVSEDQDAKTLARVARELSRRLSCSEFAFRVHDSDYFQFLLVEKGEIVDRYYSNPAFDAGRHLRPKGGDPKKILPYCAPGTSEEHLDDLLRRLHEKPMTAVERAAAEASDRARLAELHPGLSPQKVKFLLRSKRIGEGGGASVMLEEIAATLATMLGIGRERAICGYRILEQGLSRARTVAI